MPAGYKQTELGVIPEDWDIERLGELSEFVTSGSRGWAQFYSDSGALFIRSQNVRDGQLSFDDLQYVSPPAGAEGNRTKVKLHDLLITITGNSVGNVALVGQSFDEAYISQHVGLVRLKEPKRGAYICRYLSPNSPGNSQIAGSQSGQSKPGLNLQNLRNFRIALPPTPTELHAIAEALSDADALIESLEQLLTKKRQLKQGAMQELLTGKKRLPGFEVESGYKQTEVGVIPNDWHIRLLPDVCRFRGGKAHEQYISDFGRYICVNSKFISSDGRVRKYSSVSFCTANQNDILMVMSDLPNGKALAKAFIANRNNLYAVNQRVCALTPYQHCTKYLFYVLNRNPYFLKFNDGVNQTHLLNHVFRKCPIPIPPTKAEQEAIADILSDMDYEIAELEAKLVKARQLKQGMMQELLTGRIRLV